MIGVQQHTVCWFMCVAEMAGDANAAAAHYLRRQRVTVIVLGDSGAAMEMAAALSAGRLILPALELDARWSRPSDGADEALHDLLSRYDGGRLVILGRQAAIRTALCTLIGIDEAHCSCLRIDFGSTSGVDLYPSAAIARTINVIPRLPDGPSEPAKDRR